MCIRFLASLRRSKGRSVTVPSVVLNTFPRPPARLSRRLRSPFFFSAFCSCSRMGRRREDDGKRTSRMAQKRNSSRKNGRVRFARRIFHFAGQSKRFARAGSSESIDGFRSAPCRENRRDSGQPIFFTCAKAITVDEQIFKTHFVAPIAPPRLFNQVSNCESALSFSLSPCLCLSIEQLNCESVHVYLTAGSIIFV